MNQILTAVSEVGASHQTNAYSCGVFVSFRSLYFAYYGRFPSQDDFSEVDDPMARLYIAKTIYGARELMNHAAANDVVNILEDDEDDIADIYNNANRDAYNARPIDLDPDNYDLAADP